MKYSIVINPAGAGGATLKHWKRLESLFMGHDYQVYLSTLEKGITEIVHDLCKENEYLNLIVLGGDGTLFDALNGIEDFSKVKLAIIPAGSANDGAKDMKLSDSKVLVDSILKGEVVRTKDIGEVIYHNTHTGEKEVHHVFNVGCGMGYDAAVCHLVETSKVKKVLNKIGLGKLIYILIAIRQIFTSKRFTVTIKDDKGEKTYPDTLLSVAMNHRYQGGGLMFCPHADAYDNKLDYVIGNDLSSLDFFMVFPFAYFGKHIGKKGVTEGRSSEVRFRTNEMVWVQTDGEVKYQSSDITIRIYKDKLQMLV